MHFKTAGIIGAGLDRRFFGPPFGDYANLLENERKDLDQAEAYYKRALEADPRHANNLCNRGQMVATLGRYEEALAMLEASLKLLTSDSDSIRAEALFSLWLVGQAMGRENLEAERQFKFFSRKGSRRSWWSFDQMLEQAAKTLPEDGLLYARALASAFLDAAKVAKLEEFERWRELEPLGPVYPASQDSS